MLAVWEDILKNKLSILKLFLVCKKLHFMVKLIIMKLLIFTFNFDWRVDNFVTTISNYYRTNNFLYR